MSELSAREVNAGISRRALETKLNTNGRKPAVTDLPAGDPGSLAEHLAAKLHYRIESPEKTAVLDTWDRSLDILNLDGWNFRIRDTRHIGRISVDLIECDRITLEALARKIHQVLAEKGGAQ